MAEPTAEEMGEALALKIAGIADNLAAENTRLRQQVNRFAMIYGSICRRLGLPEEATPEDIAAAIDARDPVVEAAEAWRTMRADGPTKPKTASATLIAAVDAWRAAQVDRRTTPRGEVITEEQLADEIARTKAQRGAQQVAPGLCFDTMTGPILSGGQATYLTCDLQFGHEGAHSCMQDGGTRAHWQHSATAPADPAGLDPAIEAAEQRYEQAYPWGAGEHPALHRSAMTAAVRAAAPHIRRAVLLEAADDAAKNAARFRKLATGSLSPKLYHAAANALERFMDLLRERAERETT